MYAFLYVADREEGLVMINAATLLDGDPRNNFIKRDIAFNPENVLRGASHIAIAGTLLYISCDKGLVIVDVDDPFKPKVVTTIQLKGAGHAAFQFRYLFLCDSAGIRIFDVTDTRRPLEKALVPIHEAKDVYLARTYAYVAAGREGLAIIDIENPEKPGKPEFFTANGELNDTYAVKVGMTNASLYGYVADGKNGLRILQMLSPDRNPDIWGFSPKPQPELIATHHTKGHAIALSKGLDRDRGVDESGNQLVVFARRGARPFKRDEMERLYMREGKLYTVTNKPPSPPKEKP
jgi:hypothetical protein